jgi:hypothetical protein
MSPWSTATIPFLSPFGDPLEGALFHRKGHWINIMMNTELAPTKQLARVISPSQHAVLDYGVAATFLAFGFAVMPRHRSAAALAFLNGAMVLGMSLLTDYPGGVFRTLSFRGHRTGDVAQAALAGLGPVLFGFAKDPEAKYFYGQAASEAGVIAMTDWDAEA